MQSHYDTCYSSTYESKYGDFENPLFLAQDIAKWIDHADVSTMLRTVEENEKQKMTPQTMSVGLQANTEY